GYRRRAPLHKRVAGNMSSALPRSAGAARAVRPAITAIRVSARVNRSRMPTTEPAGEAWQLAQRRRLRGLSPQPLHSWRTWGPFGLLRGCERPDPGIAPHSSQLTEVRLYVRLLTICRCQARGERSKDRAPLR